MNQIISITFKADNILALLSQFGLATLVLSTVLELTLAYQYAAIQCYFHDRVICAFSSLWDLINAFSTNSDAVYYLSQFGL